MRLRCASDTWSKFSTHVMGIPSSDCQNYLARQSANRSRCRYDDDLIESFDDFTACPSEIENVEPIFAQPI